MFGLTRGEVALIVFLFALVWGAGVLPRIGERLGERFAKRGGSPGDGG
jgi:Sec-independent protein translocase protein TatA